MPRWPSLRDLDAEAPLARLAKIRAVLPVPSPGLPKPFGYEVKKVAQPLEPLPFPAWGSRPTRQLSTPLPSVVPAGAAVSRPLRLPQRVRVGQPARAPSDAAVLQDIELDKWVNRWVASLLPFAKSSILSSLGDLAEESLRNLLCAKAVNTLKKRYPGWALWCEHVAVGALQPFAAGPYVLANFFHGLAETRRSSSSVLSGLKFAASLMGWKDFLQELGNPAVVSWCAKEVIAVRREAWPLSLATVASLEDAIHAELQTGLSADGYLITAFLFTLWGALRFSDVQRVVVSDLEISAGLVRGRCWRTKSSRIEMPFGFLCGGIFKDWSRAVAALREHLRGGDGLLYSEKGARASYTFALGHLRRILVQYGGVPAELVHRYTLHSLKVTPLTWALQLEADKEGRRLWGHHRSTDGASRMVAKYSRDDVLPALRVQLLVLKSIRAGWVPMAAQGRGGKTPLAEESIASERLSPVFSVPAGLETFVLKPQVQSFGLGAESASESSDSSDCEACVAGVGGQGEQHCEVAGAPVPEGMVVNTISACVHAAVALDKGQLGRARAPRQVVSGPQWVYFEGDALDKDGRSHFCSHQACAAALGIVSDSE